MKLLNVIIIFKQKNIFLFKMENIFVKINKENQLRVLSAIKYYVDNKRKAREYYLKKNPNAKQRKPLFSFNLPDPYLWKSSYAVYELTEDEYEIFKTIIETYEKHLERNLRYNNSDAEIKKIKYKEVEI